MEDDNLESTEASDDVLATLYPNDVPAKVETVETAPAESEATEYQLTAPDGVSIDTNLLSAATPVLRDLGLSNEQASKLVPLASIVQDRLFTEMSNHHAKFRSDWMKKAKADISIGGDKWGDTIKVASGALTQCGAGPGSDVRKLSNESGLGDHSAHHEIHLPRISSTVAVTDE